MEVYKDQDTYGIEEEEEWTKDQYIEYLKNSYKSPGHPIAFSGLRNVYNYFRGRLSIDEIRNALAEIESYTLHKEFHNGQRNPSYSHFKRYQFQLDLVDVQHLAQFNDNVNYLLNCIDTWSRYAWVRLLPSKHSHIVLDAFKSILEEAGELPKTAVFDRGVEFYNRDFKAYCDANKIHFTSPDTSSHAAYIERFNRTLQGIVYKYMTENETNRYISKIDDDGQVIELMPLFLQSYNNRKHRMIGVTPYQAETQSELHTQIQKRLNNYHEKIKQRLATYRVGEFVRIAKIKGKFSRGYNEQASQEIFKIVEVKKNFKIPLYVLSNYRGDEIIKGSFYPFELVRVRGDVFRVEKVLKRRKVRGRNQLFVKWKGFDDTYNSWIDGTDVQQVYPN